MLRTKTLTHNNQSYEIAVMDLSGYLDRPTLEAPAAEIKGLLHTGRRYIVLHLGQVDGISEGGLGVLIELLGEILEHEGHLLLAALSPEVFQRLRALKLDKVFDSYSTETKALEAASQWLGPANPSPG